MQDYLDCKFSFHVWSIKSFLSIIMEIFISLNCISIDFLFVFMSDAQLSRFIQWFKTSVLNS